jgi:hypothetical protein
MLARLRNGGLVALGLLVACRPDSGTTSDPPDAAAVAGGSTTSGSASPRPGAGHAANIDRVALSADGTMAITRDQIGRVRAWTRLDGSVEPTVIPVTGATDVSIETRGEAGAATVTVLESSGAAKIFAIDADGKVTETGALPPFAPLLGAWVLPGGQRIVALFKDHTIRLLGDDGEELARLEARNFRPDRLILGGDANTFVAVSRDKGSFSIQRGRIADTKVEVVGAPRLVTPVTPMTESTSAASPDARRFAYVDKVVGNDWEIVAVDLTKAEGERRFLVQLPAHIVPSLGFASPREVLVTSGDGSLSWLLEVDEATRRPRPPAPQDFVNQGRAQAVRGQTHAAGMGTWLFVQDVRHLRHRYLGYRSTAAQSVAVSPSGKHVAWAYAQGPLMVEPFDGKGPSVEVASDPDNNFGTFRVAFVGEDRVITVDGTGSVRLVDWATSHVIDRVGVTGGIRQVHYDEVSHLLLLERHNNDARVYRVGDEGLEGPWLIADGSFRLGLLSSGAPGHPKAVVWTLDSANRLRHYTLAQLQGDLTHAESDALGRALPQGEVAPLAVDRNGRRYGVRWNGTAMEMFADDGRDTVTLAAPAGDINQIIAADDGSRFIAVHQRGQSTTLTGHDGKTLRELWSYSTGTFNNSMQWSSDGRWLGIAANTGAVVLDGKSGKPARSRCGIEFTSVGSAPLNAFNGLNLPSVCEL